MPPKRTHVEAVAVATGRKQIIPAAWLEPTSPFSSRFKLPPSVQPKKSKPDQPAED